MIEKVRSHKPVQAPIFDFENLHSDEVEEKILTKVEKKFDEVEKKFDARVKKEALKTEKKLSKKRMNVNKKKNVARCC